MFFIVVLLLASGAFAPLWISPTAHDQAITGDATLQAVWTAIYLVVALLLVGHGRALWGLLAENKALVLLSISCLASTVWSEDPVVTVRKSLAVIGTLLLGMAFAIRFELREQIQIVAAALGLAAVASLVAALCFPQTFPPTEFAGTAWNGVFSHKNLLGRSMSLGVLAFLFLDRRGMPGYLLSLSGAALCFAILLSAHSQTALVVLFAMLPLSALCTLLRWPWRQAAGSLLMLLLACVPVVWIAIAHGSSLAALLHRDMSLTGRSKIWTFAILSFFKRPWLGYGYGAFWWVSGESRQVLALIGYPTPHAHNGFLDLGLQLGAVGVGLFALGWFGALFSAALHFRRSGTRVSKWPLLFLLFLVLYSLTENSLLASNSLLWILYVASCASVSRGIARQPQTASTLLRSPSVLRPEFTS